MEQLMMVGNKPNRSTGGLTYMSKGCGVCVRRNGPRIDGLAWTDSIIVVGFASRVKSSLIQAQPNANRS